VELTYSDGTQKRGLPTGATALFGASGAIKVEATQPTPDSCLVDAEVAGDTGSLTCTVTFADGTQQVAPALSISTGAAPPPPVTVTGAVIVPGA